MVRIEPKIISEGPIDQGDMEIEHFWEKTSTPTKCKKPSYPESILNICKKAKETIIIHTPKLTLPELSIVLEELNSKGVRIYSMTTNLNIHQPLFKRGIMREKKHTLSTYLLIDPNTNTKGLWYPGELTSESLPEIIVELNKKQIDELWRHFSHEFWKATGQELFFGKMRKTPEYDGKPPEVSGTLNCTARKTAEMFNDLEIEVMHLPSNKPEEFQEYLMTKTLVTKIEEKTKELTVELDHEWTSLMGTTSHTIGFLRGKNAHRDVITIVYDWDCMIILDETQTKEIDEYIPVPEWEYKTHKQVAEIKNEIILESEGWDNPKPRKIEKTGEQRLDDVESNSIDNWMENLPRPQIPKFGGLYNKITYKWTLHPPYIPEGSKKHRLYERWTNFENNMEKKIDAIINEMNQTIQEQNKLNIKETKKITTESNINGWIKKLQEIKQEDWRYKQDSGDAKRAIGQIEEIINIFTEEIKGNKLSDNKEGQNELEEILSNGIKDKKEIKVPQKTLPIKGTLYEKGNQNYILIQEAEEIKDIEKSAKDHKATIVAERR